MKKSALRISICVLCAVSAGLSARNYPGRPGRMPAREDVYVLKYGVHSAVAVRTASLSQNLRSRLSIKDNTGYVQIAWGSRQAFEDPRPIALARSLVVSDEAVMRIEHIRVNKITDLTGPDAIVSLSVRRDRLQSIDQQFDAKALKALFTEYKTRSLNPGDLIVAARERYHVLNNCNHFVTRLFRNLGYRKLSDQLTAEGLISSLESETPARRIR